MVMAELSIVPLGTGESVSAFVAEMIEIVERSGIEYRLTPMGTIVEGSMEDVAALLVACHNRGMALANRVSMTVKIDSRKGTGSRLESKLEAVEKRLGRPLRRL